MTVKLGDNFVVALRERERGRDLGAKSKSMSSLNQSMTGQIWSSLRQTIPFGLVGLVGFQGLWFRDIIIVKTK